MLRLVKRIDKFILKYPTPSKIGATVYFILVSLFLAFGQDSIGASTVNFFQAISCLLNGKSVSQYPANGLAILFWILQIAYIMFFIRLVWNEDKIAEKKLQESREYMKEIKDEIRGAIHNTPDPEIFTSFQFLYNGIFDKFQKMEFLLKNKAQNNDDKFKIYTETFKSILNTICGLTRQFARKGTDYDYGANLMIFVWNDLSEETKKMIEKFQVDGDLWVYLHDYDIRHFQGLLVCVKDLMYSDNLSRIINPVVLPLIKENNNKKKIPGACQAVKKGANAVVINDVMEESEYGDIVRDDGLKYFSTKGSNIKSFLSIHIPVAVITEEKANASTTFSGVLNVDCNKKFLLGVDKEYADTYFTLLRPIAYLFAQYLPEYKELYLNKQN